MSIITLTFKHIRETKNAHFFNETDAKGKVLEIKDAVVGGVYLKKSAIGEKAPKLVRATFEVEAATASKPKTKAAPAKAEAKEETKTPAKGKTVSVKKTKTKTAA